MNAPVLDRLRVRYAKEGKVRFTSHRDMARIWERTLRKVGFPVAYSEGFSPRPKLSFGLALPTGACSNGEYFDIAADPSWDPATLDELPRQLNAVLPEGITVQEIAALPKGAESLQAAVTSCSWAIEILDATRTELDRWVDAVVRAEALVVDRERKGKVVTDDLRPLILDLESGEMADGRLAIVAELDTVGRALRPAELLRVTEPALVGGLIRRLHQWITADGARREPLALGAAAGERTPVGAQ